MHTKLLTTLLTTTLLLTPLFASAVTVVPENETQTVLPGTLIRGSTPSVYYLGTDGKRHVFPTEQTYFSWYADFQDVQTVSDETLASYMIGTNVTYRPGTRLVKITTDPKTYAVDQGGVLRWIENETVAMTLFGSDWNQKIDDIPDAFFINYHLGSSIASPSDFNPEQVRTLSPTINADLEVRTPPIQPQPTPPPESPQAPTSTEPTPTPEPTQPPLPSHRVSLTPSITNPRANETVHVTTNATPSTGLQSIKLFFGGSLVHSCTYTPCSYDIVIPLSNTQPTYETRAEASWITGEQSVATSTLTVRSGSAAIELLIPRPEVILGERREVIVQVANALLAASHINIYIDDALIRGCDNLQECRSLETETSPVGTVHTAYAAVTDGSGFVHRSETKTFVVVTNAHPIVTVTPGKSVLRTGETVDVTVDASDDDGLNATEIWLGSQLLKRCPYASRCTVIAGPWTTPSTLLFTGSAEDSTGLMGYATSTPVTLQ